MSIGFRIGKRPQVVAPDVVARFHGLPVANISDCMQRMTAAGERLRPMHDGSPMAGVALTVKTRPGDNLMLHKALDLAQPGDVIVVDGGGDSTNALFGELMAAMAKQRRLAGVVINGSIRDSATIRQGSFPVYAIGVTHRGPYKNGPGEINVPIAIEGMVIEPGDLIVGDCDGVLCIPRDQATTIYEETRAKHAAEEVMLADILAGTLDRAWVDEALRHGGCEMD